MATSRVDVLVITAADGEDVALKAVEAGAIDPDWSKCDPTLTGGYDVFLRRYRGVNGAPIRVATIHAYAMGEGVAGPLVAALVTTLIPPCVAMCGVCAGNPGDSPDRPWTNLGDVIIADLLYKYDRGEFVREEGEEKPTFNADTRTLLLKPQWAQSAKSFHARFLNASGAAHIATRPTLPDGRTADWRIHVGPMGTGSSLQRDRTIWGRLKGVQRNIVALDMEAAAVAEAAFALNVPHTLVVKGVMDFAEAGRGHGFRTFAAKAAAEVMMAFLRERLEPSSRGPGEILATGIEDRDPANTNPGTLLKAAHGVVPFDEAVRRTELAALHDWCGVGGSTEPAIAFRLITGAGGSGKTRLLIEWCRRLRDQHGWYAGFLRGEPSADDLEILCAAERSTCIVIDYAESRAGLGGLLSTLLDGRSPNRPPLRVILAARAEAEWWEALKQNEKAGPLLTRSDPIRLLPLDGWAPSADELAERTRLFAAAGVRFADALGKAPPSQTIDLTHERFTRPLYVQMAALAMVEGIFEGPQDLLSIVLDHERKFWNIGFRRLAGREMDELVVFEFIERMSRLMAALTMRGGARTHEEAWAINIAAEGPSERTVLMFIRGLYRPTTEAGLPGNESERYVGGLEPDLLGEELVRQVLADPSTPAGYLTAVTDDASADAIQNCLTVFARIGTREPELVRPRMKTVIDRDVNGRAVAATLAAVAVAETSAQAPLGQELAAALDREGDPGLRLAIRRLLPDAVRTVSLLELGEWSARLDRLSEDWVTESESSEVLAPRLIDHAHWLSRLGRREQAVAAMQGSIDLYRRLAQRRAGAFLPNLAVSLDNLGVMLGGLGRWEEAVMVTQEAVDVSRGLAQQLPEAFPGHLASCLHNLGANLSRLGRREEAFAATQEAVDINRGQADRWPDTFLPALAVSLSSLGNRFSTLGRPEKALAAVEEAVNIYRRLAQQRPDAFLPDLAGGLNNLGNRLLELGRHAEAIAAAQEAVEINRSLAQQRPQVFRPNLATSLTNLGNTLLGLGRPEDALSATKEAVEHFGRLAEQHPGAFLPELAGSLSNLGRGLSALGRREEAIVATRNAVDIYRPLAEQRPDAFLDLLAMATANLASGFFGLGMQEQALAATGELVDVYRRLAKQRPDTFLPILGESLNDFAAALFEFGRGEEALTVRQEARDVYRRLAHQQPEAFLPRLAQSLTNLGVTLSELGRLGEALAPAQEAVDGYRGLAQERPDEFQPSLAASLTNLGATLARLGRPGEALAVTQEAIGTQRPLAEERPDVFLHGLARSLSNLGGTLCELGRHEESLAVTQEAVDVRRRLADQRPDVFLPDLAVSLNNLGEVLSRLGLREKALAATQEAVELTLTRVDGVPGGGRISHLRIFLRKLYARALEANLDPSTVPAFRQGVEVLEKAGLGPDERETSP